MASRMKKIFHRKKDDDGIEKPTVSSRPPSSARSDPVIRTSLYEDAMAGTVPQTGDYPVKGNDSSVLLQQQGRESSVRSLRSRRNSGSQHTNLAHQSPVPTPYDNHGNTARTPPPPSNTMGSGSYDPYQQDSGLAQDFSGLNLGGGQGPTTVTTTVTTTRYPQYLPPANKGPPQAQGTTNPDINASTRAANQNTALQGSYANRSSFQPPGYTEDPARQELYANRDSPRTQGYDDQNAQRQYGNRGTPQTQGYSGQKAGVRAANESNFQRGIPQTQGYGDRNAGVRVLNESNAQQSPTPKPYRTDLPSNTRSKAYTNQDEEDDYDDSLARQPSIPRKKIGTSANAPYSATQTSSPTYAHTGRNQRQSNPKPLPETPMPTSNSYASNGYGAGRNEATSHSPSILDRSRPIPSKGATGQPSAQDDLNRAKGNTYNTEVVEIVAPAVVHETVHKDVHHVREEVITREIHDHDVYHRILPVIDIEVLPPRHFLPVEGGGLVEVSASEVPGRGQNWVIAETASNIPSDQAAPQGARGFTARQFPGREGDAMEHVTPEGYLKTEQTWVHPPELEDGARLTGQSWPMMIGDEAPEKGTYGYSSPKSGKKKHSRTSSKAQANPAQRADGSGKAS